ncbi:MAG: hypothetical protein QNJ36_17030, partial [Calothrix sp. MO_167.B42]|nr:hypothetical protein [Calothrix sp. MO_167.B42]
TGFPSQTTGVGFPHEQLFKTESAESEGEEGNLNNSDTNGNDIRPNFLTHLVSTREYITNIT